MLTFLLSNPDNTKSADFIVRRKGTLYYMEGKTLNGEKTLDHLFNKGAKQSDRIIVDVIGTDDTNYILAELVAAFQSNSGLKEVTLLKGSRMIIITHQSLKSKDFVKAFKREWVKNK